ncbi:MAG TPA: hypothetical protein VGZ52_08720 [Acidimicrobiales bacterium]|nr:hypothetical protein [Acidimicrobiales bacterium]
MNRVTGGLAAPTLVVDPNGHGTTRWEDCVPGRTEYPRHVSDIPVVGITALGTNAPRGTPGWCFRRTPRAGQGRLTGRPTIGLLLVLISPRHADRAQALRDWGDFVHLSHIAAAGVPGYTMMTPYENAGDGPRFLHLYEMDADDPEAAFQSMTPLVRARLNDDEFATWTGHPELRIEYVSTYRLIRD